MDIKKQEGFQLNTISGESCPKFNVKSTLVPCTGTGYVFLFGGFDDNDNLDSTIYLLNTKTKTWEIDDKHNGVYREGHLAIYIGQGNILVFGGIPFDEFPDVNPPGRPYNEVDYINEEPSNIGYDQNNTTFKKDSLMLIYNIFDRKWISAPKFALSSAPSPRSRHACCASQDGTKIYITGGLVNSTPLNDLYCYDLVSGIWHGPIDFAARFDHFITIHDGKLFSFGGLDREMNHVTSSIVYFNFSDQSIGEISLLLHPNYSLGFVDSDDEDDDNLKVYDRSSNNFIPTNSERIYLNSEINPFLKLEISLPLWGFENNNHGITIAYHDLSEFQYMPLVNLKNINSNLKVKTDQSIYDFAWKHAFISHDGRLYILGYEKLDVNSNSDSIRSTSENYLTKLIEIELFSLGIPTGLELKSDKKSQFGSLNLVNDFKKFLIKEEFTDFEIYTLKDESIKNDYNNYDEMSDRIDKIMQTNINEGRDLISVVKVHKSMLLARWPHFQRLISSGMNETLTNRMFIPEPFITVKALVFYLYTGSLEFDQYIPANIFNIVDYSGLLILSNLYELPDLRAQTLFQLFKLLSLLVVNLDADGDPEQRISLFLKVWANAVISNESVFVSKVLEIIKSNWSIITRSLSFSQLPKELIIRLCQDCSVDSQIFKRRSPTPMRNSFESLLSSPHTPSNGTAGIRATHSNSPFLRVINDGSPSIQDRENSDISHFPTLQMLSNDLADSIGED